MTRSSRARTRYAVTGAAMAGMVLAVSACSPSGTTTASAEVPVTSAPPPVSTTPGTTPTPTPTPTPVLPAPATTQARTTDPTATGEPTTQTSEPSETAEPTAAPTSSAPEPAPSQSPELTAEPTAEPTTEPTDAPAPATPSATTSPTTAPTPTQTEPATPSVLRTGDDGAAVEQAQERLSDLGYWLGTPDGSYGLLTQQAVMALQGAAGLQRDGVLGPDTRSALDDGVRPEARTADGRAVEIDRDAGLVKFVDDGEVELALHTSTGTFEKYTNPAGEEHLADTPGGTFEVTWAQDRWTESSLGRLYRPRYFHPDGIALHGSDNIPGYPASHGCARVSTAAMDMVWAQDLMPIGRTVLVY